METNTPVQRELGLAQIRGINAYLNTRGASGALRQRAFVGMCMAVHAARERGIVYDGGDWPEFISLVKALPS